MRPNSARFRSIHARNGRMAVFGRRLGSPVSPFRDAVMTYGRPFGVQMVTSERRP